MSGVYCSLTNEKPNFLNKCSSKDFGKTLEKEIAKVNTKLKLVENTKKEAMLHLYIYLTFSVITLAGAYFFTTFMWDLGWISSISYTIGAIGLGLIPYAISPLNKYKTEIKLASIAIFKLDEVLKLYNYSYDFDIKLAKGPHDILDVETEVKIHTKNNKY